MNKQKAAAGLTLVALGVVIGGGIAFFPSERSVAVSKPSTSPVATKTATNPTTSPNSTYKDGTYQATGSYISPAGKESVLVSLTLNNGTVSAATVTSEAQDQTAMVYQSLFVNGYKPYVVGKPINSIKVSNVAGSSLTSMGFTNALKQIKREASA